MKGYRLSRAISSSSFFSVPAGNVAIWCAGLGGNKMCSIMGYCGLDADYEAFREGFFRTKSRGPDDSRIIDTGMAFWGSTALPSWA